MSAIGAQADGGASAASAIPTAAASSAAASSAAVTVPSVLRSFLALQARRSETYSAFKSGFRSFLTDRAQWEEEEAAQLEKRSKESTLMIKEARAASASASATSEASQKERDTLASIARANEAADAKRAADNPERHFQKLCATTMADFQAVSKEVRDCIAQLAQQAASSDASDVARHFADRLGALQQLEKLKLELTIHQQMLHNQQYVLAHPRAHGQLQEHQHHVHSVTDKHGRVREHPSHSHDGHSHKHEHGCLDSVDEEQEQEIRDNDQPFTRHLSALLSETAFQTDSPFLFPPSGAAPTPTVSTAPPVEGSTLKPHISEDAQEKFEQETTELREQEHEVIDSINDIIDEVRMELEDDDGVASDEEDSSPAVTSPVAPALPAVPAVAPYPAVAVAAGSLVIRQARVEDADAVGQTHFRSWEIYRGLMPQDFLDQQSAEAMQTTWRTRLADMKTSVMLVGEVDDRVCAWGVVGEVRESPGAPAARAGEMELAAFALEPEIWGRGVAKPLLDALVETMVARGGRTAMLFCLESNERARRFYKREGWVADGFKKLDERIKLDTVRYVRSLPIPVTVRLAQENDCTALAGVQLAAWRSAYAGLLPDTYLASISQDDFSEKWHKRLAFRRAIDDTQTLVALDPKDGHVCGYITVQTAYDECDWPPGALAWEHSPSKPIPVCVGEVASCNLEPSAFGRGISSALMRAGLDHLRARGRTEVVIYVVEGNARARRFYEREGFVLEDAKKTNEKRQFPLTEVRYRRSLLPRATRAASAAPVVV